MILSNDYLVKHNINVIALQEPAFNAFNNSIASKDWITIYPTDHCRQPVKSRSLTLIRTSIGTDTWEQIDFPSSDVTVISIRGNWGKLILFNIYNDGNNNETIQLLKQFHRAHPELLENSEVGETHILWLGDFN